MTNAMTTMKIWMATPIAALPAYPTKCPTGAWSTTPWSPPMRFCSMVGQASIQTAWGIGPSTMERSRGLLAPLGIEAPRAWPGCGGVRDRAASLQQASIAQALRKPGEAGGGPAPPQLVHIAEQRRVVPERCQILE